MRVRLVETFQQVAAKRLLRLANRVTPEQCKSVEKLNRRRQQHRRKTYMWLVHFSNKHYLQK